MIDAPICTVGPSRPTDAPHSRPNNVSRILPAAMRSETRLSRGLVGQMACGDGLRDAASLCVLEEAVGQEDGQREACGRHHQRGVAEMRHQCGEGDLRQIRELCERDGRRTDRDAAQQEDGPALPTRGNDSE
ncbi:hypothetical protein ACVIGA_000884 [Bradyrhizobium sp. USDA 3240]